jgi:hypothetical protein
MSDDWILDADALPDVLRWLVSADPGQSAVLDDLEARIGMTLPEETRMLIRSAPVLGHPDATGHPQIDGIPFAAGLPDVHAFLTALGTGLLGRYLCAVHFCGAIPIGTRLQYGAFQYAMARITPWDDRHAGVLLYDEQEVGPWGSTIAGFLHGEIVRWRKAIDGQRDGLDEDELAAFEPDPDHTRDCFQLLPCDWRGPTPPGVIPKSEAWEAAVKADGARYHARSWIPAFLAGRLDARIVRQVPTPEQWEAEKASVATSYADAMYWVLAHALLANAAEMLEAIGLASGSTSTHVQAVCAAAPGLIDRFQAERQALFAQAEKALG